MHVAHLTSVHSRYDTRIFYKMCTSLAQEGINVTLIVADGLGKEMCDGFAVIDAGASKGRRDRVLNAPDRVFALAEPLDCDIYHLHDSTLR